MFGTAYEEMNKLFPPIVYSSRLLVGKQTAQDSNAVGMTAECTCLVVGYIFLSLLSFVFVCCSSLFLSCALKNIFFLILRVLCVY